jgi:hypothetical protein
MMRRCRKWRGNLAITSKCQRRSRLPRIYAASGIYVPLVWPLFSSQSARSVRIFQEPFGENE